MFAEHQAWVIIHAYKSDLNVGQIQYKFLTKQLTQYLNKKTKPYMVLLKDAQPIHLKEHHLRSIKRKVFSNSKIVNFKVFGTIWVGVSQRLESSGRREQSDMGWLFCFVLFLAGGWLLVIFEEKNRGKNWGGLREGEKRMCLLGSTSISLIPTGKIKKKNGFDGGEKDGWR